jgi:primosomal protein N'
MIAKGLDFPFVSFVGIVHADSAAPPADFRSPERLFQLITQMAGRAGCKANANSLYHWESAQQSAISVQPEPLFESFLHSLIADH